MSFFNNKGLLGIGQGALNDYLAQFQRSNFVRDGSLSDMISRISRYGSVPVNRYKLEFQGPKKNPIGPYVSERLSLMCEECVLPMKSISTQEQKLYGPVRKIPYTETFNNTLQLTFRLGEWPIERLGFENWMNNIVDPYSHDMGFYNDYIADLVISLLDQTDTTVYKIKLFEVFPENLGELSLSSGNRDTYSKQTVTFSYRNWIPLENDSDEPMWPDTNRHWSSREEKDILAKQERIKNIEREKQRIANSPYKPPSPRKSPDEKYPWE